MNAQHFYSLKLYKSYLNKEYFFHLKNGPAKLFRNTMIEVNSFTSSILFQSLTLLVEICILIAIFTFAFLVEPKIMIVIFSMFVIVLVLFLITKKIVKAQGKIRVKYDDKRISDVQNSFEAIKDVIIYNISNIFYQSFSIKNRIINLANFFIRIFSSLPRLLLELSVVLVLLISVIFFSGPDEGNGLETIGLFLIVAFRALPGIAKLSSTIQTFIFLKPSLDILNVEFFKNTKGVKKTNNHYSKILFEKNIELSNVSFFFNQKEKLINKLSIKIKKNSKTGIVGESGSGKSTLVHLILGLLDPKKGKIKIDGITLKKSDKINWRTRIGYVGQKIALINGGVKENIILDKDYDKKKFHKIIKACSLESFIKKRINDVNLKSNIAAKISGGEAQRLGLARALYQQPEILIMDESTNAIDKVNEQKILRYIYSLKSITLIFIAHNISALYGCEKIISFHTKGKANLILNKLQKK
jgi:ABC-type bacteriocin/lantibiotic exporter with double-glycine peptidase domain